MTKKIGILKIINNSVKKCYSAFYFGIYILEKFSKSEYTVKKKICEFTIKQKHLICKNHIKTIMFHRHEMTEYNINFTSPIKFGRRFWCCYSYLLNTFIKYHI